MRTRTAIVGACLLIAGNLAFAQTVDPALTAAIAARDKAAGARNADEVAKYTSDDFFAVNPGGVLNSKKQRIDALRRPPTNPSAPPQSAQRTEAVRMYGPNAAVARMRVPDNRQLIVWVKNPQGWQVAAVHIAPDAVPTPLTQAARPNVAQPTPVTAPAGLSADGAAVFAAFKRIQDAYFAGDRATYEKSMAPEYVAISPGMLRTASESAEGANGLRAQPKYGNLSVQVWDQVGVIRWTEVNAAGQQRWLTRVFAKKGSNWQQVALASTMAGNPPIAP